MSTQRRIDNQVTNNQITVNSNKLTFVKNEKNTVEKILWLFHEMFVVEKKNENGDKIIDPQMAVNG